MNNKERMILFILLVISGTIFNAYEKWLYLNEIEPTGLYILTVLIVLVTSIVVIAHKKFNIFQWNNAVIYIGALIIAVAPLEASLISLLRRFLTN